MKYTVFKHWKDLLLAFALALTTWFLVNGQEKVETWVEVRVDFKGIPHNLAVSNGLINKVNVRVRGTRGLISTASFQDLYLTVNLKNIGKGNNVIPIDPASLPFRGALEVVEITPSKIELKVDSICKVERKVVLRMEGQLPEDIELSDVLFNPGIVTLQGPENILAETKEAVVMLQVGALNSPGEVTLTGAPLLPPTVESDPPQVNVKITLRLLVKEVSLQRKATLVLPPSLEGAISDNPNVSIVLEMPKSKVTSPELDDVLAVLNPADIKALSEKDAFPDSAPIPVMLPVKVKAPKWARVLNVTPSELAANIRATKSVRENTPNN